MHIKVGLLAVASVSEEEASVEAGERVGHLLSYAASTSNLGPLCRVSRTTIRR